MKVVENLCRPLVRWSELSGVVWSRDLRMVKVALTGQWLIRVVAALSISLLLLGCIITIQRPQSCLDNPVPLQSFRVQKAVAFFSEKAEEKLVDSLPFHPFENKCKFPLHNSYAQDIVDEDFSERIRTLNCPVNNTPLATLDDDGFLFIHPLHIVKTLKLKNINCQVDIIEGGYRNASTNRGKDEFAIVATHAPPVNKRLHINADAYIVKCLSDKKEVVWEKPFAGMKSFEMEPNQVTVVPETPNFDKYGVRNRYKPTPPAERLSIDILGFDSTSRTMFQRHMPRTWETMHRLGFEVLYGYNKVGDNSMVNLAPILAGDVPEALEENKTDASGDINKNWILPTKRKLDPTTLPFLWKMMKEKFGCRSMFNEDISHRALGLFNYPQAEFKPGFTEAPADHYYRAFYLAVYKNWTYGPCKNGDQVQREFLALWHRFANKYRDVCHFGFTFITTLTHELPKMIELLDEDVARKLESQHSRGLFNNSVSIILGDHGNRIGRVQYFYSGRIEERMPLMSIRFPEWFKAKYPVQYQNFRKNKYKLTSNFDVHQMLKDIALMDFNDRKDSGRGTSLFKEIPRDRTCRDAYVMENFCMCMIDRSGLEKPIKTMEMKSEEHLRSKFWQAVWDWINKKYLGTCIALSSLHPEGKFSTIGINAYARHGVRTKENVTINQQVLQKPPEMNYLYHEFESEATITSTEQNLRLLWRFDNLIAHDDIQVNFEPLVINPPSNCPYKSLFDVCECLGLHQWS